MNPMVARLLLSAGALLLASALGFGGGWHFGGLEAEADTAKILREHAEAARDVANKTRQTVEAFRRYEQAQAQAMFDIGLQHEIDRNNAGAAAYARAVGDVRAGKLRKYWQCPVPSPAGPATPAAGTDDGAELRAAATGRIVRVGSDADTDKRALQAVIRCYRGDATACQAMRDE